MHVSSSFLRLSALSGVLLFAASLNAQSVVTIPQGYATKEGARSRHVPLNYLPARIQCGYGASATGWTKPQVITELWVRADSTGYLTTGFTADFQVWLSSKGCNPTASAMDFDLNHGEDKVLWMAKKNYSVKAFQQHTGIAPFDLQLKGDRPFIALYPTLLVDWAAYSAANQLNTNYYIDATSLSGTSSGTNGTATNYGTGCNPTTFTTHAHGLNEGETLVTFGFSQNANDIVVAWVGSSKTNISIGGGCTLYTSPLIVHMVPVVTSSAAASAHFLWGQVPAGMNGAKLYVQMAAFDQTFTQTRFSDGLDISIGNYKSGYPFTCGHKYGYASGSSTFDPDKDQPRYGWEGTAIIFELR